MAQVHGTVGIRTYIPSSNKIHLSNMVYERSWENTCKESLMNNALQIFHTSRQLTSKENTSMSPINTGVWQMNNHQVLGGATTTLPPCRA